MSSNTGRTIPNSDYRENPSRAIYIRREIDYSLFKDLLPEIIFLRGQGVDPICLYLDSNGGDVFFADTITNLIRCPNQDGQRCRLITVAAGYVASAAADILALGDYAIAYPYTTIHYHGARQQQDEITLEKIPFLSASLRATNEQYAFRLAARMFRRMIFHIVVLGKLDSGRVPILPSLFEESKIDAFIKILQEKLASQTALLKNTEAIQKKFKELISGLRALEAAGKGIDAQDQANLFKHLLDLEMRANMGQELQKLLPLVEDDYAQVRDFFFGKYQKNLMAIISQSGEGLMMPQELESLEGEKRKGAKEAFDFTVKTVSPRLEPLWIFVVSLCRSLQEGEYPLTPVEAFWAGLVDEVIDEDCHCLRTVIETADASTNEQQQLSSQSEPSDEKTEQKP